MIKNFFMLLLLILLLSITFLLNAFFHIPEHVTSFKSYIIPQYKISSTLLDNYKSDDLSLQSKASQSIIEITLKNLNYNQWLDYIDYIDLSIYHSNVLPNEKKELIVILNLSKDLAVIGLYTPSNGDYIFTNKIEDILPVIKVDFIPIPQQDYNFLILQQRLDERLGALFEEEFVEIFLYTNNAFKSVWKNTKYLNEIYNAQWVNSDAPDNQWIQIIENNEITFSTIPNVKIDVIVHRSKLEAINKKVPSQDDFQHITDICTQESFYWNPTFQQFIRTQNHNINTTDNIKNF